MTTTLTRLKGALRDSQILSRRSLRSLKFDALRLRARLLHQWRTVVPAASRLHIGCGSRRVPGWLNVDVSGSEHDRRFIARARRLLSSWGFLLKCLKKRIGRPVADLAQPMGDTNLLVMGRP